MLFYGKFENILQEGGDELYFTSLGAIGSAPLRDRSLAMLRIMSQTCVWCLGAALAVIPQGASEAVIQSTHDSSLQRLLNCNTQVSVEKPNTSPCLYIQLGVVVAAA